jgi:hypothetical protein
MQKFSELLHQQRWDDHRFYHQSRVNQSLHLFSAMCFLTTYVMLFTSPVVGVIFGWFIAMLSRQIGHFFFEPKEFDTTNKMTFEEKESVKIGYNHHRKIILLSLWALVPVVLWLSPDLFGLVTPHTGTFEYLENLSRVWLVLAGFALVGRSVWLFFIRDVATGLVWFTKILTDPFHDIYMYYKAPFYLFIKGQKFDPALYQRATGAAAH